MSIDLKQSIQMKHLVLAWSKMTLNNPSQWDIKAQNTGIEP